MLNINRTYKIIDGLDRVFSIVMKSILISILMIIFNLPLILFVIMYNGPLDIMSGSIIALLSLMIFPSYASALYAVRKKRRILMNFVTFYKVKLKENYKLSAIFTFVLIVLVVDALFFKSQGYDIVAYTFLGLSVLSVLFMLNSGLLVSTFSMSLKNLGLMNIAYIKPLSLCSLAFVLIMILPFRVDILIYLIVIGLAMFGQVYMYKSKLEVMRENITNPEIKYL